ncbi:ALG6, ALG8 glycosyltransferase family-domain-containing protein [Phakopsora pachyrhizi]|nr:ALG6, ALG8 glycosyltransferase family-domain-containing protein [Phakopsora pachyrhizi]
MVDLDNRTSRFEPPKVLISSRKLSGVSSELISNSSTSTVPSPPLSSRNTSNSSYNSSTSRTRKFLKQSDLSKQSRIVSSSSSSSSSSSRVSNLSSLTIRSKCSSLSKTHSSDSSSPILLRSIEFLIKLPNQTKVTVYCLIISSVLLIKWSVGTSSYSGHRSNPRFGDFEAQRHWLGLTVNVGIKDWYSYDLEYWGLDYPPLTAYHSWILGKIAGQVDPRFVLLRPPHLDDQTGWKDLHEPLKLFMRSTVILTELLIWIPSYLWSFGIKDQSWKMSIYSIAISLLNPNLILIDNGHFQYNSVMLGLSMASVVFFHYDRDLLGAMFFVFSLGFKQMALYYSPAIFAYLFGKCLYLGPKSGFNLFIKLAITTLSTILMIFSPFIFLSPFPSTILQSLRRIFPLGRGLFEDKVANLWCSMNVIIKLRRLIELEGLAKLSLIVTSLGVLPSTLIMIWLGYRLGKDRDNKKNIKNLKNDVLKSNARVPRSIELLPFSLFNSALSFYLFSFQVHEKSILLAILPLLMIISKANLQNRSRNNHLGRFGSDWEVVCLISNVSIFSMWPLLKRDGLSIQYLSLTILYNSLIDYNPFKLILTENLWSGTTISSLIHLLMALIHVIELAFEPPSRLPDLFVVFDMGLSFSVFWFGYVWSLLRLVEESWGLIDFRIDDNKITILDEQEKEKEKLKDEKDKNKVLQRINDGERTLKEDRNGDDRLVVEDHLRLMQRRSQSLEPSSRSLEPIDDLDFYRKSQTLRTPNELKISADEVGNPRSKIHDLTEGISLPIRRHDKKLLMNPRTASSSQERLITQHFSNQKIRIMTASGEKLMNRLKNRMMSNNSPNLTQSPYLSRSGSSSRDHSRCNSKSRTVSENTADTPTSSEFESCLDQSVTENLRTDEYDEEERKLNVSISREEEKEKMVERLKDTEENIDKCIPRVVSEEVTVDFQKGVDYIGAEAEKEQDRRMNEDDDDNNRVKEDEDDNNGVRGKNDDINDEVREEEDYDDDINGVREDEEEEEERYDEGEESQLEITVKNSREEAVRRRREFMRLTTLKNDRSNPRLVRSR